jgi:hypothetical protein
MIRPALASNSPADGASATIAAKAASRSAPLRILAVAPSVSTPTSTVTCGFLSRLRNQAGFLAAPPFEAMTR